MYKVRVGESIVDSVVNSTGSVENWSAILDANFFDTWTPALFSGQQIIIPANTNNNLNNFRTLTTYPSNNSTVSDVFEQIISIFDILNNTDNWILRTGFWVDSPSEWVDLDFWID